MSILGADIADCHGASLTQRPALTLKGIVGRALRERGMQVGMTVLDRDDFCELYAEIDVTNPAKRSRGKIRLNDEGMIRWEFHLGNPAAEIQGIAPDEIADTIAGALTRAEQATWPRTQPG